MVMDDSGGARVEGYIYSCGILELLFSGKVVGEIGPEGFWGCIGVLWFLVFVSQRALGGLGMVLISPRSSWDEIGWLEKCR